MRRAAGLATLLLAAACARAPGDGATAGTGTRESAPAPEAAPGPAAPGPAGRAPAAGPLPAAPANRVALVGGCAERCRDARGAVAGFLAASAAADGAPDAVMAFVDSTRLVVDGRTLGDRWAGLWRDLKSATRSAEMRDAARDLGRWTDGLDPAQIRDMLAAGARPLREWSTEATFEVAVPGRAPWRLTLAPRGIEWLVVEVRGPGGTP